MALTTQEAKLVRMYGMGFKELLSKEELKQAERLYKRPASLGDIVSLLEADLKPIRELTSQAVQQGMVLERLLEDKDVFTQEDFETTLEQMTKEQTEASQKELQEVINKATKAKKGNTPNKETKGKVVEHDF